MFAGDGEIYGGAGFDTVDGRLAAGDVKIDLADPNGSGGSFYTFQGGALLFGIEKAVGSEFNDTLLGHFGHNVLVGRGGNDWMHGRGGDDTLYGSNGGDYLDGGSGTNYLYGGPGLHDRCTNGVYDGCEVVTI
jgi:Ca2+-binding RTX toxin-like protein